MASEQPEHHRQAMEKANTQREMECSLFAAAALCLGMTFVFLVVSELVSKSPWFAFVIILILLLPVFAALHCLAGMWRMIFDRPTERNVFTWLMARTLLSAIMLAAGVFGVYVIAQTH